MTLVTNGDVQTIYPVPNQDMTPFINIADLLITEQLSGVGLSAARLVQVELYLSAHFALITLERGGLTRQRMGDSEDFYQFWTNKELGLKATRFGQQAMILDTSGTLAALGTGKLQARFGLVSKNPCSSAVFPLTVEF